MNVSGRSWWEKCIQTVVTVFLDFPPQIPCKPKYKSINKSILLLSSSLFVNRKKMKKLFVVLISVFAVTLHFIAVSANVIGIDFATDSLKVALIQPGTPLEIGK